MLPRVLPLKEAKVQKTDFKEKKQGKSNETPLSCMIPLAIERNGPNPADSIVGKYSSMVMYRATMTASPEATVWTSEASHQTGDVAEGWAPTVALCDPRLSLRGTASLMA